jgi:L,D-transpeptidase ErfK/SrfK
MTVMKRTTLRSLLLITLLLPLQAAAREFPLPLPGNDAVGQPTSITSRFEDTLSDIARTHDLGYLEISEANPGVDPWLPGEGLEIILPTQFLLPPGPREGIVINLAELRLYFYPKGENRVITYPLGIGREGWETPTAETRVVGKKANPTWTPPESIRQEHLEMGDPLPRVVQAGPDNPLGRFAIYMALPGYLLHGTNKPFGVGMRVSHGCIRLYPEDIERLFPRIPVNTPIRIINEPYKLGWIDGQLYLEAHQPLSEQRLDSGIDRAQLEQALNAAIGERRPIIDQAKMMEAALTHNGMPVRISLRR